MAVTAKIVWSARTREAWVHSIQPTCPITPSAWGIAAAASSRADTRKHSTRSTRDTGAAVYWLLPSQFLVAEHEERDPHACEPQAEAAQDPRVERVGEVAASRRRWPDHQVGANASPRNA